jgi:FkbM family methyltransferase
MSTEIFKGELNLAALPGLLNRQDPVILDIGTNNGGHTRAFFDLFPFGLIHSFEPDPRCIAKFKANLASYPRAKLHEIAVGAFDGTAEFYASGGQNLAVGYTMPEGWDMSGSLRKPKDHLMVNPGITFDNKYPVQVVTLDTWFKLSGLDTIDFIWADVQGAESDLIEGGKETFARHVKYFYTEYSDAELYENQLNLAQILKLLPDYSIVTQFENDVLLQNNRLL